MARSGQPSGKAASRSCFSTDQHLFLAFIGAYFVERYDVGESAAGIVLAIGAGAFFVTSVRGARHLARLPRPRLIAATTLAMGALISLQFSTDDFV